MARDKSAERHEIAQRRYRASPLWSLFVSGMSSVELAQSTGGRVARATAGRFLEGAVEHGAAVRRKEKGVVRYWRTEEQPADQPSSVVAMRPLKRPFPGRGIIPVRDGGREVPVMREGFAYQVVGERGGV